MTAYVIDDAGGRREVEAEDFPLTLGGAASDLRLNGLGGGDPVAYLGISEGDLFVQPAPGESRVSCNGTLLAASQWLRDGDELRLGSMSLAVESAAGETRFIVRQAPAPEAGPRRAEPPVLRPPPREEAQRYAARGARIQPIAFAPGRDLAAASRRRRLRPGTVLAVAFLAALAAAAAFVFTSRSVLVEIEPPPDRMAIEGGIAVDLGGRRLMRPGRYRLVAEKEGFRRLEAPLEVSREASQVFRFELARLPGLLEIAAAPGSGVEILVDGEVVGVTPLDQPLELSPGEHEVRLRADRYREFAARMTIEGAGAAQTLEAELVPRWAPVSFRSRPAGAAVRVDGAAAGRTPVTAEVIEGVRTYEMVLAGYKPHRGRVSVTGGEPLAVAPVDLVPSDGNVVLSSDPEGATVAVDGVYRGRTPLDLRLEPGRPHRIQVSKAGYEAAEREVEVGADETRELSLTLAARQGELRIVAWPADAELWVDGEARGKASGTLQLTAVPHQIEIRKAGYSSYDTRVTPIPGVPQALEVSLETAQEAAAAATPESIRTAGGYELRRVEPGRFLMGASRREPGRRANETLREVELTRPFYLGTKEVTNGELRRFAEDHLSGQIGGRTLDVDGQPAVRVTWEQAAAYCNWLSAREDLPPAYVTRQGKLVLAGPETTGYRLPTEAEWSWAARFPDGKAAIKFPWGESLPVAPGSGNYADLSAREILPGVLSDYDDRFAVTAPVASFAASALGLYDLGGNVAEWVHDYYAIRPAGNDKVARDPFGPDAGDFHVIRGSSWMHSTVTELRLTFRDYGDEARPDVGFRVARYLD